MPTYEYQCTKCGEEFEYFQSIKDTPKTECEKCGGNLTKLLSAGTGLIFKGSGFYITDYKPKGGESGNGAASTPAAGKADGAAATAPAASSESKPAAAAAKSGDK